MSDNVRIPAKRAEVVTAELVAPVDAARDELLASWLGQYAGRTREAYAAALHDFMRTVRCDALDLLRDRGVAFARASAYREAMLARHASPSTINQRLAALRSLVSHAENLGLVTFALKVRGVKSIPLRDVRGPGRAGFVAMLAATVTRRASRPKGRRDRCLLWLLFGLGLRRGEACSLDLEHVDMDRSIVWVLGKGQRERIPVTMSTEVRDALQGWIEVRGTAPGPLFLSMPRGRPGGRRVTGRDVHRTIAALGRRAGIGAVRPHGLRHSAITAALDLGADVRAVQRFSRHADVRTVVRYDDARQDLGGQVARLVGASVGTSAGSAGPDSSPPGDASPKAH